MEERDLDNMADLIRSIRNDPKLSPHQKRLQLLPIVKASARHRLEAQKEVENLDKEIAGYDRLLAAYADMESAWGSMTSPTHGKAVFENDVAVQKNDCSRLHRLVEAFDSDELVHMRKHQSKPLPRDLQVFVVSHDWAAVVEDSPGDEIRLPADKCAFEYRFSGRNVIVISEQGDDQRCPSGRAFYETGYGAWMELHDPEQNNQWWWREVRAACIVLDAQVATYIVHRQPAALNAKRARAGKLPMYDFHVIDLDPSRHRVAPGAPTGASGSRKRLHFCRGHWRHYEKSKTWIRWCLKGDPDLGFVDKEYRL